MKPNHFVVYGAKTVQEDSPYVQVTVYIPQDGPKTYQVLPDTRANEIVIRDELLRRLGILYHVYNPTRG